MKYVWLLVLAGCGGQEFQAEVLPHESSEGAPAAEAGPEGGFEAVAPDGGGAMEATTCDVSPTQACKKGTPCCEPSDDAAAQDAACAQVPMQSTCPIPGGEPRLIPGLLLAEYPSHGTCAGLPTPPSCACEGVYTCACVMLPSNRPCGITKCSEADLSQGLPLTIDCL